MKSKPGAGQNVITAETRFPLLFSWINFWNDQEMVSEEKVTLKKDHF